MDTYLLDSLLQGGESSPAKFIVFGFVMGCMTTFLTFRMLAKDEKDDYLQFEAWNQRVASITGNVDTGIVFARGSALKIVRMDDTLLKLLGFPRDQVPESVHSLIPSGLRSAHQNWLRSAVSNNQLPGNLVHPLRNVEVLTHSGKTIKVNVSIGILRQESVVSEECLFFAMVSPVGGVSDKDVMNEKNWRGAIAHMYGVNVAQIVANGNLPSQESYSKATVLFLDICNFTRSCMERDAVEVAEWMRQVHNEVEAAIHRHHIRYLLSFALLDVVVIVNKIMRVASERRMTSPCLCLAPQEPVLRGKGLTLEDRGSRKIETRGDCYVCVTGTNALENDAHHNQVERMLEFARDTSMALRNGFSTEIRVGISTGPVTISFIKTHQFAPTMCIFGDTVCTAARMEQSGSPGHVHLCKAAAERYAEELGVCTPPLHWTEIKSKGTVPTAFYSCQRARFLLVGEKVGDAAKAPYRYARSDSVEPSSAPMYVDELPEGEPGEDPFSRTPSLSAPPRASSASGKIYRRNSTTVSHVPSC